jgi:hypothetical protein
MEYTRSIPFASAPHSRHRVLQPGTEMEPAERPAIVSSTLESVPTHTGYGLPCANCRTYYAADQAVCPVCKSNERVSATVAPVGASQPANEPIPESTTLEEERERFLQEFKSQIYSARMEINAAASFRCSLEENHPGGYEVATVCQSCHNRLQEQVDQMEAALHIDLKEAAQIVYDAVWSDPADSTKSYQRAAQALLSEIRTRAGISVILGPLKPLTH